MTTIQTDLTMRGLLAPGRRRDYCLAGNAIVTIRSISTGNRYTYKIQAKAEGAPLFVKVLTGADNVENYQYLGAIFEYNGNRSFRVTRKSHISDKAPSARAFSWFFEHIEDERVEVWHEGVCGRCGRRLTVPESIASGIGPTCAGKS